MHQNSGLSTSRTCSNDNIFRILVIYYLQLSRRQRTENIVKLPRCNICYNLRFPAIKIFTQKKRISHLEIIFDKLQGILVVIYHLPGILAHDMDLLHLVFIEFFKTLVICDFVLPLIVHFEPFDRHSIVYDHETSLNLESTDPRKIKEGVLHIVR